MSCWRADRSASAAGNFNDRCHGRIPQQSIAAIAGPLIAAEAGIAGPFFPIILYYEVKAINDAAVKAIDGAIGKIIGIPLLVLIPFAILALALFFVVGFTAVASYVGRLVSDRLGSSRPNPYLTAILGIVVVMSPILLGRIVGLGDGLVFPITAVLLLIGFAVEYLAWTVGFGAVALNRFDRHQAQPSTPAA